MNEQELLARQQVLDTAIGGRRGKLGVFYNKPMAAGAAGAAALAAAYNLILSNDNNQNNDINPLMAAMAGAGVGAGYGRMRQSQFLNNLGSLPKSVAKVNPSLSPEAVEDLASRQAAQIVTNLGGLSNQTRAKSVLNPDGQNPENPLNAAYEWLADTMAGGEKGRIVREIARSDQQKAHGFLADVYAMSQKANAEAATVASTAAQGTKPKKVITVPATGGNQSPAPKSTAPKPTKPAAPTGQQNLPASNVTITEGGKARVATDEERAKILAEQQIKAEANRATREKREQEIYGSRLNAAEAASNVQRMAAEPNPLLEEPDKMPDAQNFRTTDFW